MIENLPHICIDGTCIVTDTKGASVYALSLLTALQKLLLPIRFTVLMRQETINRIKINNPNWKIKGVTIKSTHLWHILTLPRILRRLNTDLLFVLGETPLAFVPIPYILTIHELPHLYRKLVGNTNKSLYHRLSQRLTEIFLPSTCRQAAHLLAISRSTATDLQREFQISRQKISVTYEGADIRFFQTESLTSSSYFKGIPHPYLLTFATGDKREVPEQVVRAYGECNSQIPHHLVIAGNCSELQKSTLVETAVKLDCLDKLYFTGYVPDDDLPFLYSNADIYIEMSRYEGFGLQVCEAMAAGTAVIATEVASLPEVVGDGGYLVELGDTLALIEKILFLLKNPTELQKISKLAQQQAAKFSWEKCALETWNVIDKVISKGVINHANF
ncbi:glycosyltransferase family 4 protein [Plectonema cf. radiosum LEGE 06105]|uniref:Glycosyltransferase family 4 protein n=1 Tax=Plectonema cf. radiosum LEGE 06105 TaxID=945769 RepID=A0A8J7JU18_9CYAN|nr:glycosyltransferase family 1 protein [Plectonema radiosum]MBE9214514.1 glycosyltransferase family 4 protein [Plectonema cf. radiosum LEGE 06105]